MCKSVTKAIAEIIRPLHFASTLVLTTTYKSERKRKTYKNTIAHEVKKNVSKWLVLGYNCAFRCFLFVCLFFLFCFAFFFVLFVCFLRYWFWWNTPTKRDPASRVGGADLKLNWCCRCQWSGPNTIALRHSNLLSSNYQITKRIYNANQQNRG